MQFQTSNPLWNDLRLDNPIVGGSICNNFVPLIMHHSQCSVWMGLSDKNLSVGAAMHVVSICCCQFLSATQASGMPSLCIKR